MAVAREMGRAPLGARIFHRSTDAMKLRKILVPLDGSAFGERAIPFAAAIVERTGCAMSLVHVRLPVPFAPEGVDAKTFEGTSEQYLAGVESRLAQTATYEFTAELIHGRVEEALADRIETSEADLVVMATHGRGPFSRFWLGSVAEAIIRRVTCPVLLVRQCRDREAAPGGDCFRHVLVPLDGSPAAEQVLEPALTLGTAFEARYTLVRAATVSVPLPLIEDPGSVAPMLEKQERDRAVAYLEGVATRLRDRGAEVEIAVPSAVHAAEGILSHAVRNLADLIAVTTSGRGGVDRGRIGSVADKIIRGAETPVLVLKPSAG
jgi:nucleotide-binding universal stress UspA family protein